MYDISIVNEDNSTIFLIPNSLSVQISKITIDGRNVKYHYKERDVDLTEIIFEELLSGFVTNTFLDIKFFDFDNNPIFLNLTNTGNYPAFINQERYAIISQLQDEKHLSIKFLDFRSLVFQMKNHSPFLDKVFLKNSSDFIAIRFSNMKDNELKDVIVSCDTGNSLDSYIIPVIVKDNHILIAKTDISDKFRINLLIVFNTNAFKLSLNNLLKKHQMKLGNITSTKQSIKVKENDIVGYNINDISHISSENNKSHAYINSIDIKQNTLVLNVRDKDLFVDLEIPIIILQEVKTKRLFAIRGAVDGSKLLFNISGFLKYIPISKENWNLYLMGKGNTVAFKLNNKFEKNKKLFHIFEQNNFPSYSTYNLYSALLYNKNRDVILKKDKVSNLVKHNYKIKTSVIEFKMLGNRIKMGIQLKSPVIKSIKYTNVYLVHRNKDGFNKIALGISKSILKKNYITLKCNFDLRKVDIFPLYWDVFIGCDINGTEELLKITNISEDVYNKVDSRISKYQYEISKGYIFYPYITINKDLAFTYRKKEYFENRYYLLKENIAFLIVNLLKKHFANREIWIGFEKLAMSAHESGYYFFDYVYKNNKYNDFYYVIRKDSPELNNLRDKEDKVLYFMSLKYFIYMFAADLLISSDTKRNSYNLKQKKSKLGKELTNKQLVYLQHGVNGLKAVPDFYKNRGVFDLVIAPSQYEKNMITKYWGYDDSEVVATGLARWDVLEDKTETIDFKQIFVMPTWRTWMDGMSKQEFLNSEYYRYYNDFLSSDRLDKILKKNNIKIKFFLHPKFKDYIDLFEFKSTNIEKFGFLEVPLDEMIMRSSMMVSDYSSVIWEMFYLKKPCLFYHFDVHKYLQYEGSYMNFEQDLFGDIAYNSNDLISLIEEYISNNFQEKLKYSNMRDKYFTYMDKNNSKRIFEAIETNKHELKRKRKKNNWKLSHVIPFDIRRKILNIKYKIFY